MCTRLTERYKVGEEFNKALFGSRNMGEIKVFLLCSGFQTRVGNLGYLTRETGSSSRNFKEEEHHA